VVSVLAIGPKVRGLKPSRRRWIFNDGKIRITTSFGGEMKPQVLCGKILWHIEKPLGMKAILRRQNPLTFLANFLLYRYVQPLLVITRELWWMNWK
jgi:hypothetical protein